VTVGERLRQAVEERGSIRQFQRKVAKLCQERGIGGSSYSMIYKYLQGTRPVPLPFAGVAAELLGVSEAWLLTGEGDIRAAERDPLAERAPLIAQLDSPLIWDAFLAVLARFETACMERPTEAESLDMAEALHHMITEPLEIVVRGISLRQIHDFVVAQALALMLVAPERGSVENAGVLLERMQFRSTPVLVAALERSDIPEEEVASLAERLGSGANELPIIPDPDRVREFFGPEDADPILRQAIPVEMLEELEAMQDQDGE
jgi:transcriptional regulator with XRE-family HTH domain